ncbi:MAG TPA: hypothetical protein VGU43_07790 [Thermoplasmata archaeon]|nr:hypothetical protein [Thermoplasmata archaeon]
MGEPPNDRLEAAHAVRTLARALLLLLVAQYLLGEWVNLDGSFPDGPPSLGSALVDASDPALALHLLVALALLFGALLALAFGWVSQVRRLRLATGLGFLGVLLAAAGGALFVYSGYANAGASFLMAGAFLLAFSAFASAHFLAERELTEAASPRAAGSVSPHA